MRRLFVIALALTIVLPLVAVLLAFAAVSSQAQCAGGAAGPGSVAGVPSSLLPIFEQAAGSYQLGPGGWTYLAAINEVESNFDYSTLPGVHSGTNPDGAAGPMQIGIGGAAGDSWARYQVDAPGGPLPPSVYDETDAVYAAANYLHASALPATGWQRCTPTTTPPGTSPKSSNSRNATHRPPAPRSQRSARPRARVRRRGADHAGIGGTDPSRWARRRPAGRSGAGPGRCRGRRPDHRHLLQHRAPAEHAEHGDGLL